MVILLLIFSFKFLNDDERLKTVSIIIFMKVICFTLAMSFLLLSSMGSACVEPYPGMVITENTTFCARHYTIPYGILINASNIHLDCGLTKIHVTSPNGKKLEQCMYSDDIVSCFRNTSAIVLNNVENVKVENCIITSENSSAYGMVLYKSSNNIFVNNNPWSPEPPSDAREASVLLFCNSNNNEFVDNWFGNYIPYGVMDILSFGNVYTNNFFYEVSEEIIYETPYDIPDGVCGTTTAPAPEFASLFVGLSVVFITVVCAQKVQKKKYAS